MATYSSLPMQTDPIEGGTPNNYVYALDPINFNDFSGMLVVTYNYGMQLTIGASSLQPAAAAVVFHPTVSAVINQKVYPPTVVIRLAPVIKAKAKPAAKKAPSGVKKVLGSATRKVTNTGRAFVNREVGGFRNMASIAAPPLKGAIKGCIRLALPSAGVALGMTAIGGPGGGLAGLIGVGWSCEAGLWAGYFNTIQEGSGTSFEWLDTGHGVYDIFRAAGF